MATSNEKQVQLRRETLLNDEVVLEDVFPKTMTDAVTDINSGASMSEVLDTIMTVINNKLSRNVNSVNGRSGVVLLDASDVGLGNVDNVSTADLKAWVINYVSAQFHDKRMILEEYYSGIQALIDTNNDKYDGVPFVCQHFDESDPNDETMVIGYMFMNENDRLASQYFTFNFGDKGVGRFEYDINDNVLGEYFNVYEGEHRNKALGLYSTAKGYHNVTHGQASMVIGNSNVIDRLGQNSFVSGSSNEVNGYENGIVFGYENEIIGGRGSLIGGHANVDTSNGENNIISGLQNTLSRVNVSGYNSNSCNIITGKNNVCTDVCFSVISGIGNHVSNPIVNDDYQIASSITGNYHTITRSYRNSVSGYKNDIDRTENSVISGSRNKAEEAQNSLALGERNTMSADHSFIGGMQCVCSGPYSSVIGYKVQAKGSYTFIIGKSSNGFNPEILDDGSARYQGVDNMTVREMIVTHKTTPFSIAYGDCSFVAGQDNLGIGTDSFTIGKNNINESPTSFVSGRNNRAAPAQGIHISGVNNYIAGQFSSGSGVRNTTNGHVSTVMGAFNNGENYTTVIGVGSTYGIEDVNIAEEDYGNIDLKFDSSLKAENYSMRTVIMQKADYIDIPVPLLFCPLKAKNMVFVIKYENNEWSGNTMVEHQITENVNEIFQWQDDIKAIRISRDALANEFHFTHSFTPGETSYELDVLDLRDVTFDVSITFVPNLAEKIGKTAFKVGNGPFADTIYRDDAWHANAFEVLWDGRTVTQKDIVLKYKSNPNTDDAPIQISFKKLIDTLISSGNVNLNDIIAT